MSKLYVVTPEVMVSPAELDDAIAGIDSFENSAKEWPRFRKRLVNLFETATGVDHSNDDAVNAYLRLSGDADTPSIVAGANGPLLLGALEHTVRAGRLAYGADYIDLAAEQPQTDGSSALATTYNYPEPAPAPKLSLVK